MIEINNFLEDFNSLKQYSLECEFKDEVNPVDGVAYPHICKGIPESILNDLFFNLTHRFAREPQDPVCFLRMSPAGVPVPHRYHTDNSMGRYSLMLYLQDNPSAGTGLATHLPTGVYMAPENEGVLNETIKDCNDDSKWKIYKRFVMQENKAVIFDSRLFHVALPIGGFGEAREDSRIVFTCFYS